MQVYQRNLMMVAKKSISPGQTDNKLNKPDVSKKDKTLRKDTKKADKSKTKYDVDDDEDFDSDNDSNNQVGGDIKKSTSPNDKVINQVNSNTLPRKDGEEVIKKSDD